MIEVSCEKFFIFENVKKHGSFFMLLYIDVPTVRLRHLFV